MFEFLGLVAFSVVVFLCLVVIPNAIEMLSDSKFRDAYFSYLGDQHLNTYGK